MLTIITGPIYSGKTTEFINIVESFKKQGLNVLTLKPIEDTKYSRHDIVSHDNLRTKGFAIEDLVELEEFLNDGDYDVIAIDEVQFINDWNFVPMINEMANQGTEIILSGLNTDFKGEVYGVMGELCALADKIIIKYGTCPICGRKASRSQRLVNGQPARQTDPISVSGDHISYEPRCRKHHVVR